MVGLVTVTLCIVTYWYKTKSGLEKMAKMLNQQTECGYEKMPYVR